MFASTVVGQIVSYISLTRIFLVIYHFICTYFINYNHEVFMGIYDFVVQRIYQLCHEREITPNALSYLCGISQSTLKSILNGESKNPGVVTIKKICDGLDITLVEFFDTEEYKILEQEIK